MIACGGAQYAKKVLRYGKLGDVVGGQEKAGEGDEHGAVYEDRPVLRTKRVPDVHQRIPQQGRQLHRSAAAGQLQPVQQHRKFIQRPECCQQCNDHKTQDDGRGDKNVRSIAVVQVMHGREPECQRPELLHQRDKQQVGCDCVQSDQRRQDDPGMVQQSTG